MIPVKYKRLVKEGYQDCRDFGLKLGTARMRCILEDESIASVQAKNAAILEKLNKDYAHLLSRCTDQAETTAPGENAPIWMLWWDGKMPPIIELCYHSKLENAGSHPVILLTKDNVRDYVAFPPQVWEQFQRGKLRIAHLADMIRVQLIRRYGGLWLDASIYCSQEIPEAVFELPVYSIKGDTNPAYISDGRWTTFAIGGWQNNILCSFLDDFFQEYVAAGNRFLDYYMFDCAIALAYQKIPAVGAAIDNLPKVEKDIYWLNQHLELPPEPNYEKNLPCFSKISWQRFGTPEDYPGSLYAALMEEASNDA